MKEDQENQGQQCVDKDGTGCADGKDVEMTEQIRPDGHDGPEEMGNPGDDEDFFVQDEAVFPRPPDEHIEEKEEFHEVQDGISAQDEDFLPMLQQGLEGVILEDSRRQKGRRHQENSKDVVKHGEGSLPISFDRESSGTGWPGVHAGHSGTSRHRPGKTYSVQGRTGCTVLPGAGRTCHRGCPTRLDV